MQRPILFGMFFIIFFKANQINAAQKLYGQSSGRIWASSINSDSSIKQTDDSGQYPLSYTHNRSPTFMQSRLYHNRQNRPDSRQFVQPSPYQTHFVPPSHHTHGGTGIEPAPPSQEGCRLTNSYCSGDYQCCSGKCRCVRWSVMGKMSCWKKCY